MEFTLRTTGKGCENCKIKEKKKLSGTRWRYRLHGVFVPVNSKTAHAPPPRANPRAFDFCEKFWSNSPLCCQFRRSNAPPVRTSKRVKSPTLSNKFCKIVSHYEFLVQLVFAPHFKQRSISRLNYIKRQQQKNPRGIGKRNDP